MSELEVWFPEMLIVVQEPTVVEYDRLSSPTFYRSAQLVCNFWITSFNLFIPQTMSHDRNCLFDIYWEYLHLNSLRRIISETQFQKLLHRQPSHLARRYIDISCRNDLKIITQPWNSIIFVPQKNPWFFKSLAQFVFGKSLLDWTSSNYYKVGDSLGGDTFWSDRGQQVHIYFLTGQRIREG